MFLRSAQIIFCLVLTVAVYGQSKNDSLAQVLSDFILEEISEHNIPGLSASIIKDGGVVWMESFGLSNIEEDIQVTNETIFGQASISKLFTVLACLRLSEEGIIDIDKDINSYLPVKIINPNFPDIPITSRQLMLHKSSLRDRESDLQLWINQDDPFISLDRFCNDFFVPGGDLYQSTNWSSSEQPGEAAYWYTNAGFTLLGYVIQGASDVSFNQYCKESLFDNLDMPSAGWFYEEVDSLLMAMPYDTQLNPYGYYSVPEYPAAMMKCNVIELSNFLIAITNQGVYNDYALVNPLTFNQMLPSNMEDGLGWWGKNTWYGDPNGNYWSHGGFLNGIRTQLNYYPEDDTGLIILTNGEGRYLDIQNKMESMISEFETTITSIVESEIRDKIFVYPNPVSERLIIDLSYPISDNMTATITDMNGNIVLQKVLLQTKEIDVSKLIQGVYSIQVRNNDGLEMSQMIVVLD